MPVMRIFSAALAAAMSASACQNASAPLRFVALDFTVESDPGVPLEGTSISLDGELVGRSNSAGFLSTMISGAPGRSIRIDPDCPTGYRDPTEPRTLTLGTYRSIGGGSIPRIEVALRCPPEERVAVVVVRAQNGADLPVFIEDQQVGRTNALGVAHFSTLVRPGAELRVWLDTSGRPDLIPRNPSQVFRAPDANEVFVVDQSFERTERKKPPRVRRPKIIKIE